MDSAIVIGLSPSEIIETLLRLLTRSSSIPKKSTSTADALGHAHNDLQDDLEPVSDTYSHAPVEEHPFVRKATSDFQQSLEVFKNVLSRVDQVASHYGQEDVGQIEDDVRNTEQYMGEQIQEEVDAIYRLGTWMAVHTSQTQQSQACSVIETVVCKTLKLFLDAKAFNTKGGTVSSSNQNAQLRCSSGIPLLSRFKNAQHVAGNQETKPSDCCILLHTSIREARQAVFMQAMSKRFRQHEQLSARMTDGNFPQILVAKCRDDSSFSSESLMLETLAKNQLNGSSHTTGGASPDTADEWTRVTLGMALIVLVSAASSEELPAAIDAQLLKAKNVTPILLVIHTHSDSSIIRYLPILHELCQQHKVHMHVEGLPIVFALLQTGTDNSSHIANHFDSTLIEPAALFGVSTFCFATISIRNPELKVSNSCRNNHVTVRRQGEHAGTGGLKFEDESRFSRLALAEDVTKPSISNRENSENYLGPLLGLWHFFSRLGFAHLRSLTSDIARLSAKFAQQLTRISNIHAVLIEQSAEVRLTYVLSRSDRHVRKYKAKEQISDVNKALLVRVSGIEPSLSLTCSYSEEQIWILYSPLILLARGCHSLPPKDAVENTVASLFANAKKYEFASVGAPVFTSLISKCPDLQLVPAAEAGPCHILSLGAFRVVPSELNKDWSNLNEQCQIVNELTAETTAELTNSLSGHHARQRISHSPVPEAKQAHNYNVSKSTPETIGFFLHAGNAEEVPAFLTANITDKPESATIVKEAEVAAIAVIRAVSAVLEIWRESNGVPQTQGNLLNVAGLESFFPVTNDFTRTQPHGRRIGLDANPSAIDTLSSSSTASVVQRPAISCTDTASVLQNDDYGNANDSATSQSDISEGVRGDITSNRGNTNNDCSPGYPTDCEQSDLKENMSRFEPDAWRNPKDHSTAIKFRHQNLSSRYESCDNAVSDTSTLSKAASRIKLRYKNEQNFHQTDGRFKYTRHQDDDIVWTTSIQNSQDQGKDIDSTYICAIPDIRQENVTQDSDSDNESAGYIHGTRSQFNGEFTERDIGSVVERNTDSNLHSDCDSRRANDIDCVGTTDFSEALTRTDIASSPHSRVAATKRNTVLSWLLQTMPYRVQPERIDHFEEPQNRESTSQIEHGRSRSDLHRKHIDTIPEKRHTRTLSSLEREANNDIDARMRSNDYPCTGENASYSDDSAECDDTHSSSNFASSNSTSSATRSNVETESHSYFNDDQAEVISESNMNGNSRRTALESNGHLLSYGRSALLGINWPWSAATKPTESAPENDIRQVSNFTSLKPETDRRERKDQAGYNLSPMYERKNLDSTKSSAVNRDVTRHATRHIRESCSTDSDCNVSAWSYSLEEDTSDVDRTTSRIPVDTPLAPKVNILHGSRLEVYRGRSGHRSGAPTDDYSRRSENSAYSSTSSDDTGSEEALAVFPSLSHADKMHRGSAKQFGGSKANRYAPQANNSAMDYPRHNSDQSARLRIAETAKVQSSRRKRSPSSSHSHAKAQDMSNARSARKNTSVFSWFAR